MEAPRSCRYAWVFAIGEPTRSAQHRAAPDGPRSGCSVRLRVQSARAAGERSVGSAVVPVPRSQTIGSASRSSAAKRAGRPTASGADMGRLLAACGDGRGPVLSGSSLRRAHRCPASTASRRCWASSWQSGAGRTHHRRAVLRMTRRADRRFGGSFLVSRLVAKGSVGCLRCHPAAGLLHRADDDVQHSAEPDGRRGEADRKRT